MDEPTSTMDVSQPPLVSPPRRRRSRWLTIVAIVLAVLIGGAWWLSRPRIDPRFVGTWSWHLPTVLGPNIVMNDKATAVFTLNDDGTGSMQLPGGPTVRITWSVNPDGEFAYSTGLAQHVAGAVIMIRSTVLGEPFVDPFSWRVHSVADDRIEFGLSDKPTRDHLFKRVSTADPVR